MPLYLVEFSDGQAAKPDVVEAEAPDPEAARTDAMRMLADTARFEVTRSNEQLLVATIRDNAGRQLYRVVLALTCARLGQESGQARPEACAVANASKCSRESKQAF